MGKLYFLIICIALLYCVWGTLPEKRVYREPVRDTDELRQRFVATWAEFQQRVVYGAIDQWRKNWKHVSMQNVVTLNTCYDVAFLTFQLSHTTTGSFQSHSYLKERSKPSVI